ncbi:hypothetical protein COO60DRAFT_1044090 [Scenedesmus sp. NREL 46B-D3]|nr:hypothetical protein COO60DRAFT_1044090 [Scenedesmus sp. NREL 46B-D3]
MLNSRCPCFEFARQKNSMVSPTYWPSQLLQVNRHGHSSTAGLSRLRGKRQAASTAAANSSRVVQATASTALVTCRRCKQRFSEASNTKDACRYHPALYSGGEVAKAIGFVRASDAAEDQLERVVGRKGLMRFWDCCGSEDEGAPGCCVGFHVSFDDELNEAHGWR